MYRNKRELKRCKNSHCNIVLSAEQWRNRQDYCSDCKFKSTHCSCGNIKNSRFELCSECYNKTKFCKQCQRKLGPYQIQNRQPYCSNCSKKYKFFKEDSDQIMDGSSNIKFQFQIRTFLIKDSVSLESQISIPNAQILRQNLKDKLIELYKNEKLDVYKLMIVMHYDYEEINKRLVDFKNNHFIRRNYTSQFDYCCQHFKQREKKLLQSRLQEAILNHNHQQQYKKRVDYVDIDEVQMILFTIDKDQQTVGQIRFTQSFRDSFRRYHQQFNNQQKKRKLKTVFKSFDYTDHFAIGFCEQDEKKNFKDKNNIDHYNFYKSISRKNVFIRFDISSKFKVIILLYINYLLTIRVTININDKEIDKVIYDKYKQNKRFLYFFLKKTPSFEAHFNPQCISNSMEANINAWFKIDDFSLINQKKEIFKDNQFLKLLFSKSMTLVFSYDSFANFEPNTIFQWKSFVQTKNIETKIFHLSEIETNNNITFDYGLTSMFWRLSQTIKHEQMTFQERKQYLMMLHYTELDILYAIQNDQFEILKYFLQRATRQTSQSLYKANRMFQIIKIMYQRIHVQKGYLNDTPLTKFDQEKQQKKIEELIQNIVKIRQSRQKIIQFYNVSITPNGFFYKGYTNQYESRIFRAFQPQLFIKGTFCNQNGTKIKSHKGETDATFIIQTRYKEIINGFTLRGVKYVPIGWSNSQIKKSQLWFVNSNSEFYKKGRNLRDDIYSFLGDFSSIKNPAKKASRIGQSFAASVQLKGCQKIGKPVQIEESLTPLKKKDNQYIQYAYSDGFGMMSKNLLEQLKVQLKLNNDVCAIQCRYLGIKGVLAYGSKSKQSENKVYVPPSMVKYVCQPTEQSTSHFDVLNWNKYSPGYMNAQIILLLLSLGISQDIFIEKIKNTLHRELYNHTITDQMIINYYKTHLDYSPTNQDSLYQLISYINNSQLPKIQNLLRTEKFFCQMTDKVKREISLKAKNKLRIRVQQSARLMGILDTFGVLKQNQVFCAIHKSDKEPKINITQRAFMTKNPCLHPGDIRTVRCVSQAEVKQRLKQGKFDEKQFDMFVNVIVFPKDGQFPLSAQISGGDLDGDYYLICWDPELIPKQSQIFKPPHLYDDGVIKDKEKIQLYEKNREQKRLQWDQNQIKAEQFKEYDKGGSKQQKKDQQFKVQHSQENEFEGFIIEHEINQKGETKQQDIVKVKENTIMIEINKQDKIEQKESEVENKSQQAKENLQTQQNVNKIQVISKSIEQQQLQQKLQKNNQSQKNPEVIIKHQPSSKQNEVMSNELLNFYIYYLQNTLLGLVTRYHLITAQYKGAKQSRSIKLAQIHSKQLDFAKKGQKQKVIPQQLIPPNTALPYKQRAPQQRKLTALGRIYHEVCQMYNQNGHSLSAPSSQKDNKFKFLAIDDNWAIKYFNRCQYCYSKNEFQQQFKVIVAYKKDIEQILFNHQKPRSSEFTIYHGRDQNFITDSITLRQKYQDRFFKQFLQKQIYYQQINLQTTSMKDIKFGIQLERKAFLWYLISNSSTFVHKDYIKLFTINLQDIIIQSYKRITKLSEELQIKIKSSWSYQPKLKSQGYGYQKYQYNDSDGSDNDSDYNGIIHSRNDTNKLFPNVIGLTWHAIPKIIIFMASKHQQL